MNEFIYDAKQEFKRADHLLYVSLKYTRTADVIRNTIQRLISTFDFIIDGLLQQAFDERQIEEIPKSPKEKVDTLRKVHSEHETFLDYMKMYQLFRKIIRAEFTARQEFRRHVTMTSEVDEKKIEVSIDILSDYYHRTAEFLEYVENQLFDDGEE